MNPLAIDAGLSSKLNLTKQLLPTKATRKLSKQQMLHNSLCPNIDVNAQTFEVFVDGKLAYCDPAETVPLGQRYMLR